MESRSIEAVVRALNDAKVRYLIVGGVAVVAHGFVRLTQDLDLILDLEEANVRLAIDALTGLQYRPLAPVPFAAFADAAIRDQWIREKHMTVFSLHSPVHPRTEVDLFAAAPLDFETAYQAASWIDLAPGVRASFISLADLLALKKQAGRPKDLLDIERLETLQGGQGV